MRALAPRRAFAYVLVGLLAAAVLLPRLGDRYLWQDEASTALLSERLLDLGRPLAWDGKNLLTMDRYEPWTPEEIQRVGASPRAAIEYFVARGDFKPDTTWTGHPWGTFVLTATSFALLGRDTWAARLPFALCGLAVVLLTFHLGRTRFSGGVVAPAATALLLGNVYWLLHMRQCRYYAPSALLCLATLWAWWRWQEGRRYGGIGFVVAGWMWFQFDFGTVWPATAILLALAAFRGRSSYTEVAAAGAGLVVTTAPFVWFYDLATRGGERAVPWWDHGLHSLALLDAFVLSVPVAVATLVLLGRRDARTDQANAVALFAVVGAIALWSPLATPYPFFRYLVPAVAPACLLTAWVLSRLSARMPLRLRTASASLAVALLLLTPAASLPLQSLVSEALRSPIERGGLLRPELAGWVAEVRGALPDPNRQAVEFLRAHLQPGDEVVTNYEDKPLMFYTSAAVRGGIPAFRIADPGGSPPRFAVLRRSASASPVDRLKPVLDDGRWEPTEAVVVDVPFGNNPDPEARAALLRAAPPAAVVLERLPRP